MAVRPEKDLGMSKSRWPSPTEEEASSNTEHEATVSHAIGLEVESMAAITAKRGKCIFRHKQTQSKET